MEPSQLSVDRNEARPNPRAWPALPRSVDSGTDALGEIPATAVIPRVTAELPAGATTGGSSGLLAASQTRGGLR